MSSNLWCFQTLLAKRNLSMWSRVAIKAYLTASGCILLKLKHNALFIPDVLAAVLMKSVSSVCS